MGIVQNKKFNKIFQIGFNKCGTVSIHEVLIEAGLKSVHWDEPHFEGDNFFNATYGTRGLIGKQIVDNIVNGVKPLEGVDQYDCYVDMEWLNQYPLIDNYKLLDKTYPRSLFIFNTRPLHKWIKSKLRHGMGNHWKRYQEVVAFKGIILKSKKEVVEYWKKEWEQHHSEVLRYFEDRDDFVFFNIENESQKLIDFLNKWGIPAKTLPHKNKTRYVASGKYNPELQYREDKKIKNK